MTEIDGLITVKNHIGSEILTIDGRPLSKMFSDFNGKTITLHIDCGSVLSKAFKGTAEVFYFEGTQEFHRGTKYVNAFFIEDDDILEHLIKLEGKKLRLTASID
ncbi:hypothetical protein [Jeotgalibacillus soli]|uniref:Uncharacterized protein n=1 Tax=Jeotgalibacillus soli TaxID=889306 RepID=A0A0C2S677_9BACL|nr:hypothetical protein [Jeotgalibacillus soli]KIL49509.1 hypothetical protein KP78_09770 [Jeotgalibacillus soli]